MGNKFTRALINIGTGIMVTIAFPLMFAVTLVRTALGRRYEKSS